MSDKPRTRIAGIQNCELETFGVFGERLSARSDVEFDLFAADRGDPLPEPGDYAAFLIGGTPVSAYNADAHPFLRDELATLREAIARQMPLLGICCGAQMLAILLGAEVRRAEAMEIGGYELCREPECAEDPVCAGLPERFPVVHWHGDTFEIPPGASRLVTGAPCENQMFRTDVVYGVQFHLETRADEFARWADAYGDELRAAGRTTEDVVAEARASEPAREELAVNLIDRFVELATGYV